MIYAVICGFKHLELSNHHQTTICLEYVWNSVWWFQIFVIFIPICGFMIQFDLHIFSDGLVKNHQLPRKPSRKEKSATAESRRFQRHFCKSRILSLFINLVLCWIHVSKPCWKQPCHHTSPFFLQEMASNQSSS